MWYRIAQNTSMQYQIKKTSQGDAMYITSGLTKDFLRAQPIIFIIFKDEEDSKYTPISKKLSQEDLAEIFRQVQNELAKYPPGWIAERLGNDFQIQVFAKLYDNPPDKSNPNSTGSTTIGETGYDWKSLSLSLPGIIDALHHEIGHQIHFQRIKQLERSPANQDSGDKLVSDLHNSRTFSHLATSEYGKTDDMEAFAEAFQWLAQNGLDKRFPISDKINYPKNKLLDMVASEIKTKGYKTVLKDFGNTVQLAYNPKNYPYSVNKTLYNLRLSTIVGGFQSAIDRFQGDKNSYATNLITNQEKIKYIVDFLNRTQSEFFAKPILDSELKAALEYLKEKIDKNGYVAQTVQDRKRK
jgi:hypothetical protein